MTESKSRSQVILVVGGGIGGITTTLEAAEAGYEVILLEKEPTLGGRVAQMYRYFPKLCHPSCGLEINFQRIRKNPLIKVFTMTTVTKIRGGRGDYMVTVRQLPRYVRANCTACGDCAKTTELRVPDSFNYCLEQKLAVHLPHEMAFPMRYVVSKSAIGTPEADKIKAACKYDAIDLNEQESTFDLHVGAIVWATGWQPYDAARISPYRYDYLKDVITNVEMERLAAHNGPTQGRILCPSDGREPKRAALIQCAGSRDYNHLAYCSRICCLASMKHAVYLREQYPEIEVDIYYIDIRAHDKLEIFYRKVINDARVQLVKSKPAEIKIGTDGHPVVCGENTLTRELYAKSYDLVVLATGMQPTAGITDSLATKNNLSTDEYGFILSKEEDGIFSAGVASAPLDVSMSVQSATAAALKAIQAVIYH